MARDWDQSARTVLVGTWPAGAARAGADRAGAGAGGVLAARSPGVVTAAGRWRRPRTGAEAHTWRARSPPYQPIRKARTVSSRAVVDTYRSTGWPGSTL